jgi:hypothetical protein
VNVGREIACDRAMRTRALVLLGVSIFCAPACGRALGLNELTFERDAMPGAGGSDGEPVSPGCRRHAECVEANFGEPSMCRNSSCVALKNTEPGDGSEPGECRVVIGAQSLESGIEPFLVGALMPIDIVSPESSPAMLNYKLAIEEISVRGSYRIAGQSRTPVVVACNAETSALSLDRSLDHLVDTLGVHAIITAISDSEQLKRSIERVLVEKRKSVFFLNALSAPPFGSIEPGELLWHLLPNLSDLAPVYDPLVRRVEDYVNPAPPSSPRPPLRLALVVATDFLQLANFGEALNDRLTFNGKTALENGPEYYRRLGVSSVYTSPGPDVSAQLVELLEFRPHVIVSAAGPEFVTILRFLEEEWPITEQLRPFYLLSPDQVGHREFLFEAIFQGELRERGLVQRIVGVNHARAADPTAYDRYLARLKGKFPDGRHLDSTGNFYDAAYFVAYAAAAGATTPLLSGADLASGMRRLLDGERIDVGPVQLPGALAYLRDDPNSTIALHGTLGPPAFSADRARRGTGSIWCVRKAEEGEYESGGYEYRVMFDALRYDANNGTLAGSIPCFDGF